MKQIIVTGGAGFIGSHTVVELYNAGYLPIIVDNFVNSEEYICERINQILDAEVPVIKVDCCEYEALKQALSKYTNIKGIIHFAAYKAVGESVEKPLSYYENNLVSLINMLRLCKEMSIPDLVFSSSCTVYGQPETLPVDENAPIRPAESPYGNTKQVGEEIIRDTIQSGQKTRCISLRYFNPIGAHPSSLIGELPIGRPNNLVPFITQTAAGQRDKLTIFGNDYPTEDGTNIRDYIHVVDLSIAHVRALDHLSKTSEDQHFDYVNLGTGKGSSVLEVVKTFEQVSGEKLNYEIGPRRSGDVIAVFANADKAEKILGWKTEKSLGDALLDAWNWQKTL